MFLVDSVLRTQFSKIFYCFLFVLDQPTDSPDVAPTFVIQVVDWFHTEQYPSFSFPNFFCPRLLQPRIIFSELRIHLAELVREDSSFQTEFFLCHVDIMTHFRNHHPFFLSTVIFQHLKKTHHLASVSRSFQHLDVCQRFTTLDDAGCCWLPLAAACWKNRHTEGMCTYFSLLREQWWSQLSRLNGFCDVRRNDCSNVINVGAETVLSWREVDRRVLAGDLDQVFGIITCSEALFSHLAKPWTAPWIGAGCAWFRTVGKRGGGSGTPSMLRWNMWRQDDFWETADSNAQLILNQRMCVDEVSRAREKCASVVRTVTCSVFTSRRVHDIHKCLYANFFFLKKNNRPTGKEICKVTWRFRTSALIRSIPAIRANLVVLATVGVPTRLPKMKGMTPVIQISFDNFDFAIPSLIAAVRWMVAVVLVLLEGM